MAAYASGYATVLEEVPYRICEPSSGSRGGGKTIPRDLVGTSYYRAGPAMFSAGSIVPPKTSIVQPRQLPVPDGYDTERMVLHPMEGDGAVLGVTFAAVEREEAEEETEGGEEDTKEDDEERSNVACVVRYRYVRTPGFTNERKKGQRLYTGMDSTRMLPDKGSDGEFLGLANDHPLPLLRHHYQPGLNKLRRHTANTRAVYWGGRLFCLWEGGQPYKMDGRALGTEGRSQFGGAILKDTDPLGGAVAFDSSANHRALFYGISHGPQASDLTLYEFDKDFRLVQPGGRRTYRVPGFLLVTDIRATANYAVFVAPTVQCNAVQFLVNKDPGKVLQLEKGGNVLLVPRAGGSHHAGDGDNIRSIPIPPDHLSEANLQLINAYEQENLVVLDVIRSDGSNKRSTGDAWSSSSKWPWATTLQDYRDIASQKSLWRYTVDPRANSVSKELLLDRHVNFATIHPERSARRHEHIYMNIGASSEGSSPPQGIFKYTPSTGSVQEWMPEPHEFCGEPVFAPRLGDDGNRKKEDEVEQEDYGYLLSVLFNGKTKESELIVLDASDVSSGPLCRIPLGFAVPHGFHGCHTRRAWSPDEIARRAKLHDKMESRGNYWNEVKSDFSGLGLRLDDMEEYFGDFFS
jgi:all-trans-8'-apo-beta-carotenal 15,15'-oxygenase